MSYFKAGDTISGQEAVSKITQFNGDGTSTIEDLFFGKNLEASCQINKTGIKTLGKRGEQQKASGWKGTGSVTVYYASSIFRKMAINYIKTGVLPYFNILVSNEDPASTIGKQTTVLKNCTIDAVVLAKFDVESTAMDEKVDFTFDDADLLDEFGKPVLG